MHAVLAEGTGVEERDVLLVELVLVEADAERVRALLRLGLVESGEPLTEGVVVLREVVVVVAVLLGHGGVPRVRPESRCRWPFPAGPVTRPW
ncbi:hypothetical protein Cus16_2631 [Curtobacterium sp. ER1/6]|nr:hypothetical protein Cus16_2631 [Curtobacterium sp. ER1/6]